MKLANRQTGVSWIAEVANVESTVGSETTVERKTQSGATADETRFLLPPHAELRVADLVVYEPLGCLWHSAQPTAIDLKRNSGGATSGPSCDRRNSSAPKLRDAGHSAKKAHGASVQRGRQQIA